MFIPRTFSMTDAPPEARLLTERSEATRYVAVIVSESFNGWGAMRSNDFACPFEPRGRSTMLVVESYYVSGGALYWWWR